MKKALSAFLLISLFLISCTPELDVTGFTPGSGTEDSSDLSTIIFSAKAGTATISLYANKSWSLEVHGSEDYTWLSIGPSSGGKGSSSINIKVIENDSHCERSATLVLTCDNISKEIKVIQHDTKEIIPLKESYEIFYDATMFELPVQANVDYKVSTTADWLRYVETKALRSDTILFDVDRNDSKTSRNCSVIITDGAITRTINITQLATTHFPKTDEEQNAAVEMNKRLAANVWKIVQQSLIDSNDNVADAEFVLKELIKDNDIVTAVSNSEKNVILYMQRDSVISLLPLDYSWMNISGRDTGIIAESNIAISLSNDRASFPARLSSSYFPNNKEVMFYEPFRSINMAESQKESDKKGYGINFSDVYDKHEYDCFRFIEGIGYNVHKFYDTKGRDILNAESLQKYDYIIISTHGCYTFEFPDTKLWEISKAFSRKTFFGVYEEYDKTSLYEEGVVSMPIFGHSYVCLCSTWFENQNMSLNNSLIYTNACGGYYSDDMAEVMIKSGAIDYVGYDMKKVNMYDEFVLLENFNACLAMGLSIDDAISLIKRSYPDNLNSKYLTNYRDTGEPSFLFSPYPFNLSFEKDLVLSWDMPESFGVYSFDIYLDDTLIGSTDFGSDLISGDFHHTFHLNDLSSGWHSWYVVANVTLDYESVIASYKSDVEEFTYTAPYIDAKLLNEDISCEAGTVTVEVDSNVDVSVDVPDNDWLTYKGVSSNGKKYTFSLTNNTGIYSRSVNVKFYNRELNLSTSVRITQNPAIYPDDWTTREFWRRAFVLLYARQGCSPAPPEMDGVNTFKSRYNDKVEVLSVYCDDGYPLSRVFNSPSLVKKYDFSYTPCTLFNGKDYVRFRSTSADTQREMIKKVDANKARTGIGFTSRIEGSTINVDVSVLVKSKGNYSISIFLMEDNVIAFQLGARDENNYRHNHVARKALTADTGDKFSTTKNNVVKNFSYSTTIPSSVNKNNLKVLVVTHIENGSYSISYSNSRNETFYGSYVDNAASEKAGVRHKVDFIDNRDGNNENIIPGGDIDFN